MRFGGLDVKKYCKKTSVQSVADEVKIRKGSAASIQGSQIATDISNLVIPVQRGTVNKELKTNDTSYSILRGVYNNGSVYVDPVEWPSVVQPSVNQQIIKDANNRPLKKVSVGVFDFHPLAVGSWRGSQKNPTSLTVSGLPFTPAGVILICGSNNSEKLAIGMIWKVGGVVGGHAMPNNTASDSNRSAVITSADITFSYGGFSVSNVRCTDTSGTNGAHFYQTSTTESSNAKYLYYVWG